MALQLALLCTLIFLVCNTEMPQDLHYYVGFLGHFTYITPFVLISMHQLAASLRQAPNPHKQDAAIMIQLSCLFIPSYLLATGLFEWILHHHGHSTTSLELAILCIHRGGAIFFLIAAALAEVIGTFYALGKVFGIL